MAVSDAPIVIKKIKKVGQRRPPRRRLEGRLRRLRHRHDGLLPADVADQHHQPRAEARHRRLFRAGLGLARPPAARAASSAAPRLSNAGAKASGLEGRHPDSSRPRRRRTSPTPARARTSQPPGLARAPDTKADDAALTSAAQSLRQAMQDMPELAELSKQIIVDQTPEGLRIQLVDQEGRSMFNEGSAAPNDRAKLLLAAVARVVSQLPNRITIAGHTSAERRRRQAGRRLDAVVGPGRRRARVAAGRRRRRRPHLPGGGQGRVRSALSRRSAAAGQPAHHHHAAARGAGAAVGCGAIDWKHRALWRLA